MKKLIALVLAMLLALGCVACAGNANTPTQNTAGNTSGAQQNTSGNTASEDENTSGDVFKLGLYSPITGPNAAYGIELRNGVELGVNEINAAGGLNGQQVQLIVYDTQCSTEEAAKVAIKLIEEDHVDACIGSLISGEVFAAGPYFNNAGIYMLGTGTSASWMKEDWPYVFRPAMNNDFAVPIAAGILTELGYTKVAIFNGQDDAALITADTFVQQFESMGIEVVDRESYDAGDTDYSGQIARLMAADPEIILMSVIGETAGPLVRQLRQAGYTGLILDKESFMATQIEVAGAANSNYICFANPYVTYESIDDCDIPIVKEYLQAYYDAYGTMVATDSAYRGYDAIRVLWEAAKLAGSNDSDALVEATNKLVMDGLGGTIDFTSGNREAYNTFNTFILVDGKNILFSDWVQNGGYDAYLEATGRAK